jgi:hypothetical protein
MKVNALSKIDNLEVQVRADKDFSVHLADEELNWNDYFWSQVPFFGLAGEFVLEGKRRQQDTQWANNIRAAIADINLQSFAEITLIDGLQTSLRFKTVTAVTHRPQPSAPNAGLLLVRIDDWGLYAGSKNNATLHKVQVGFSATASLVGGGGKLLWKRKDYFTSGEHRSISEYGASSDLLKNEFYETVTRYCVRLVNEIRYSN